MAGTISGIGFDGADVVVRGEDVQGFHVRLEEFDLAGGEVTPVHAGRRGALQQRVIDVGDVLDVGNPLAGVAPGPVQQVKGHIAGRVAHVRGVIRGDPADVHRLFAVAPAGSTSRLGRCRKGGGQACCRAAREQGGISRISQPKPSARR